MQTHDSNSRDNQQHQNQNKDLQKTPQFQLKSKKKTALDSSIDFQEVANNSPQAIAQRKQMNRWHNSPKMVAQRKEMNRVHQLQQNPNFWVNRNSFGNDNNANIQLKKIGEEEPKQLQQKTDSWTNFLNAGNENNNVQLKKVGEEEPKQLKATTKEKNKKTKTIHSNEPIQGQSYAPDDVISVGKIIGKKGSVVKVAPEGKDSDFSYTLSADAIPNEDPETDIIVNILKDVKSTKKGWTRIGYDNNGRKSGSVETKFIFNVLNVDRGKLTFSSEGENSLKWGGMNHEGNTRIIHSPGGLSGVTIGRGYDMSLRSVEEVKADLKLAGLSDENQITKIAKGAGVKGTEEIEGKVVSKAGEYVKKHKNNIDPLTYTQQRGLFEIVHSAKRKIIEDKLTLEQKNRVDPALIDYVTDFLYHGVLGKKGWGADGLIAILKENILSLDKAKKFKTKLENKIRQMSKTGQAYKRTKMRLGFLNNYINNYQYEYQWKGSEATPELKTGNYKINTQSSSGFGYDKE